MTYVQEMILSVMDKPDVKIVTYEGLMGCGVIATRSYEPGEPVMVYKGHHLTPKEAEEREDVYNASGLSCNLLEVRL